MATFHDNKLWQDAYVAALDVTDVLSSCGETDLLPHLKNHSLTILTVAADALSRRDRREMDERLRNVNGLIAALRSLLSVAWAQETLNDEQFSKLDTQYEALAKQIRA